PCIEPSAPLQPGVTQQQAQQEFAAISGHLEAEYPATNRGRAIRFWPLWQTPFNNAATLLPTLEIMLVVVACVLLIACANVGNLLLVRSFARPHEMSVRLAGGAAANTEGRPRAVYERGIYRSSRRSRPRRGALRLGAGASLAQLCFAGWHRSAHAELAEGPQR